MNENLDLLNTYCFMDSIKTKEHTISGLSAHLVWASKYRYSVLEGDIKIRCRTLLIQICEAE